MKNCIYTLIEECDYESGKFIANFRNLNELFKFLKDYKIESCTDYRIINYSLSKQKIKHEKWFDYCEMINIVNKLNGFTYDFDTKKDEILDYINKNSPNIDKHYELKDNILEIYMIGWSRKIDIKHFKNKNYSVFEFVKFYIEYGL